MEIKTTLENLLFTTVKIETTLQNGKGTGTGFFYMHHHKGQQIPFIVTNKHVIEGGIGGSFTFTKAENGQPLFGQSYVLQVGAEIWASEWFGHPDEDIDIAVLPLGHLAKIIRENSGVEICTRYIEAMTIPTPEQLDSLNIIETVTFVGYPNGLWDKKNLIPIIRRGTTATPLHLDFEGDPKFLIDASVFGGSSGSPVFIADTGAYSTRDGTTNIGARAYFIGVIAAVYYKTDRNTVIPHPIPTNFQGAVDFNQMIDLGVVFKAHTVITAIEAFFESKGW